MDENAEIRINYLPKVMLHRLGIYAQLIAKIKQRLRAVTRAPLALHVTRLQWRARQR